MTKISLTEAGKALVAKLKSDKNPYIAIREENLKMYTIRKTGEKVVVDENRIFPKRNESLKHAA